MPRQKLTASGVEKIKPPKDGQLEYFDELLPSFGIRVSYSGTKAWFVMTRVDGKLIRMTIGRFSAVTLKQKQVNLFVLPTKELIHVRWKPKESEKKMPRLGTHSSFWPSNFGSRTLKVI